MNNKTINVGSLINFLQSSAAKPDQAIKRSRPRPTTPLPAPLPASSAVSQKKAKKEDLDESKVVPLRNSWNPHDEKFRPRHTALSLSATAPHPADLQELSSDAGRHLVNSSAIPQVDSLFIVVSNVDPSILAHFADWANGLQSVLPSQGSGSIGQSVNPPSLINKCTVPPEADDFVVVLPLAFAVLTSVPYERKYQRRQVCPVFVYYRGGDDTAPGPLSSHVISYIPLSAANIARGGTAVGAVRCFAHHQVDVALNRQMIQRMLADKVGPALGQELLVIPSLIFHPIPLSPPDNCEIIFRIIIGKPSLVEDALRALFRSADEAELRRHPGEILFAEFNFLLVWNAEDLLGLPYDKRLSSPSFSLPDTKTVYQWKFPSLQALPFGDVLVVFLRQLESESSSASSLPEVGALECCRFISRENSYIFFMRLPLSSGALQRLSNAFPLASCTELQCLPSESHRSTLLRTLHELRTPAWHASWVPALPLTSPLGVTHAMPRVEEVLAESLRGLSSVVEGLVVDVKRNTRIITEQSVTIAEDGNKVADLTPEITSLRADLTALSLTVATVQADFSQLKDYLLPFLMLLQDRIAKLENPQPADADDESEAASQDTALIATSGTGHPDPLSSSPKASSSLPVPLDSTVLPPDSVGIARLASSLGGLGVLSVSQGDRLLVSSSESPSAASAHNLAAELDAPTTVLRPFAADGMSYSAQTSPPPVLWPLSSSSVFRFSDTLGCEYNPAPTLLMDDSVLSAGLSPFTTELGKTFIRVTLLLPAEGWGISLLVPTSWAPVFPVRSAADLFHTGFITLHRFLKQNTLAKATSSLDAAICWVPTRLESWLTLDIGEEDVPTISEVVANHVHLGVWGGETYSLRSLPLLRPSLPATMATKALNLLETRCQNLQTSAIKLITGLSKLVITSGNFTLTFSKGSAHSASIILQALSNGGSALEDSIRQLCCAVTYTARCSRPEVQYAGFNMMHAFADWRFRHTVPKPSGSQIFLTAAKNTKPGSIHGTKVLMSARKEFTALFVPPTQDDLLSEWKSFATSIEHSASGLPVCFKDDWLEINIARHRWLGCAWRSSDDNWSPVLGMMSVHDLIEGHSTPQIALFSSPTQAKCFRLPALPPTIVDTIRDRILSLCTELHLLDLEGLHEPDPLGLLYPSTNRMN